MALRSIRLILALVVLAMVGPARAAELKIVSQGPTPGGWQYIVSSPSAGREFRVQVAEPDRLPWRKARLPAVFVIDGDALFGRVRRSAEALSAKHQMTPAYVVAVGYPPGVQAQEERLYDLVHSTEYWGARQIGGRGQAFETFLLDELQPFIERRYRVDHSRSVLMGHSLGGLFTTAILARRTDAFGGYLIASPSLQYAKSLHQPLESARGDGRRVFVTAGGKEAGLAPVADLLAGFLAEPKRGFKVKEEIFMDADHMGVLDPMMAPALAFLLPPERP